MLFEDHAQFSQTEVQEIHHIHLISHENFHYYYLFSFLLYHTEIYYKNYKRFICPMYQYLILCFGVAEILPQIFFVANQTVSISEFDVFNVLIFPTKSSRNLQVSQPLNIEY